MFAILLDELLLSVKLSRAKRLEESIDGTAVLCCLSAKTGTDEILEG